MKASLESFAGGRLPPGCFSSPVIIGVDITAAPAEVPPTTAPSRYRTAIAASTFVPPMAAVSRAWSPPPNQIPVAPASKRTASSLSACSRVEDMAIGHGADLSKATRRARRPHPRTRRPWGRGRCARLPGTAGERQEALEDRVGNRTAAHDQERAARRGLRRRRHRGDRRGRRVRRAGRAERDGEDYESDENAAEADRSARAEPRTIPQGCLLTESHRIRNADLAVREIGSACRGRSRSIAVGATRNRDSINATFNGAR